MVWEISGFHLLCIREGIGNQLILREKQTTSIWKEEDNKNSIKNYGFIRLLRKWLDVKWSCTILNYKRCYFSNFTSWQVQTLVVCGWGFKSNINYSLSEAWFLLVLFKYYKPIDNIVHITRVGNEMKISKKPSPKGTFRAHPVKL